MDAGFCAIPVIKFQAFMQSDYQLNLLENYLTRLKFSNNMEAKNKKDFGFLAQYTAIKKQKKRSSGRQKEDENSWYDDSVAKDSLGFT